VSQFRVGEVEKLLRLSRATIRSLVEAGFVHPARGPRNAWLFSFQDLIALRTAQALAAANVPAKRITRSMRELRRHLPREMPLSGLRIAADGDRVVVREGASRWQADSGQYLLAFEGDPSSGSLSVLEKKRPAAGPGPQEWLDRAAELEGRDPERAVEAYRAAIAADGACLDAHINIGSLLHELGQLEQAEAAYRAGLFSCPDAAVLHYNLGVLLDDMDRKREAFEAYEAALRADPRMADCHYNLALLCEDLAKPREAIRHMAQYRRLTRSR
jgi:tetratricopeptide (TPR) repeat protein